MASDVGQRLAAASKAGTHQPWRVHIGRATLAVAFPHPSSDIVRGMRASERRHWPKAGSISQGMPASAVAGAYRMGDITVSQRQAASAN